MDGILLRSDPLGDLVRDFATRAARHDRDGSFPHENFAALHEAGLLGLTARRADGGEEAGLQRVTRLVGRVARGCPATALVLAMQLIQLRGLATNEHAPRALVRLIGRGAVERGELVNALRVEPELGTPARGGVPATTARWTPEGWRISGRKIYSTGSPALRWMLVWLRTDEASQSTGPRTGFVAVRADTPGIRIEEAWDAAGLRASGSHDVVFEDVLAPLDHAVELRLPADWPPPDGRQAGWNTLPIAALYTGVAWSARDWLVQFLRDRVPTGLGVSLATLPRMQEAVGRIDALLLANDRLVASGAADEKLSAVEAGLIKTVAAENAIAVVNEAVALCGNHGIARANPLERHLRDVLCARIHTPQPDSAYAAAGRRALATR